jgi:hypothetical protein
MISRMFYVQHETMTEPNQTHYEKLSKMNRLRNEAGMRGVESSCCHQMEMFSLLGWACTILLECERVGWARSTGNAVYCSCKR